MRTDTGAVTTPSLTVRYAMVIIGNMVAMWNPRTYSSLGMTAPCSSTTDSAKRNTSNRTSIRSVLRTLNCCRES